MKNTNHKRFKQNEKNSDLEFKAERSIGLLDFLYEKLPNKSANKVKSILAHGLVTVGGVSTTKYDFPVREGQTVLIKKYVPQASVENELLNIIYEDSDIIVINKPAGLLTIATEKEKLLTAYHFVTDYVRMSNPDNRIFIIHRLDRDTSGVVLFAKTEEIKLAFQEKWDELVKFRGYYAIAEGVFEEKSGRIQSWLKETKTHVVYSSGIKGDGKEAITQYKVIKESSEYSMLDIQLETGRKNQIRVQLKDIGHCVIGDKKYGAKTNPLRRLGLHAYKLEVIHPFTEEMLSFEAKADKKFFAFVGRSE